jgi:hypothetical protein
LRAISLGAGISGIYGNDAEDLGWQAKIFMKEVVSRLADGELRQRQAAARDEVAIFATDC